MARKPRVESNVGLYHVINRGNYKSPIFETQGGKNSFVKTLFEACDKFSWELSAFCLMSNHYHLCLGTPLGNLSVGMRWLQATFAVRFNKYRKEHGHLFQGRFKSLVVEPGQHWLDLVDYIHLNPVRAGQVEIAMVGKYKWSSLFYFPNRLGRHQFLNTSWMDYFGDFDDSKGGWTRYFLHLRLVNSDDPKEIEELDRRMCRGWSLGSSEFRKAVSKDLARNQTILRIEREDLADIDRTRWETYLESCLKHLGKSVKEAQSEKRSANWKLAISTKMKRETSVTNLWLTDRLHMGSARSVSAICGTYSREKENGCQCAKLLKNLTIDH
jgi:REP element-mobilizing transposase RayT